MHRGVSGEKMMKRSFALVSVAVVAMVAVGCTMPPPPDPDPEPELCQPGTFSATGEEPCTPAPIGTFVDTEGATGATPCPLGTFQDLEGQASCNAAAPGTFQDLDQSKRPAGHLRRSRAQPRRRCPPGRFQPDAGADSCLLAPIGTYVDTAGAIAATDCPAGTTTAAEGSTSLSDCETPATLAVAYSNLDGIDGYDPNGTDILIAKLVDTNSDGEVSVDDTVTTNQYPLDLDATAFGAFQVTTHVVSALGAVNPTDVAVDGAGGARFVFISQPGLEGYVESLPTARDSCPSTTSAIRALNLRKLWRQRPASPTRP